MYSPIDTGIQIWKPADVVYFTLAPNRKQGVIKMGMVGCFAAVGQETLRELKDNPEKNEEYLYPNDGEDEPPNYLDVDKAWHGIHFMLTGSAEGGEEPLSLAILGGEEVGEDMGYGPARLLTPQQVKVISAALTTLREQDFRSRFAPHEIAAAGVYPEVIWVRDGQEALDYVVENYRELVKFYADAAARGDGAILWLS
mgnify:CR=1 FL=1